MSNRKAERNVVARTLPEERLPHAKRADSSPNVAERTAERWPNVDIRQGASRSETPAERAERSPNGAERTAERQTAPPNVTRSPGRLPKRERR